MELKPLHVPDMVGDEAGGGDEEVLHSVKAPAHWLRMNGVVGDSATRLIDHLVSTNTEDGGGLM